MPYTIHKRGPKFCVVKEGGETIACHPTRTKAEAQLRALYASENKSFVIKGADARYMFLISSNAYQDREREIVREKALTDYVTHFQPNDHLFWHGGDPIGRIIYAEMAGPFLIEISKELPDAPVNLARDDEPDAWISRAAVWDVLEQNSQPWGASIGFYYQKGDEQDRQYETILKKETSTLPLENAANGITLSNVIGGKNMSNAVKTKRRNILQEIGASIGLKSDDARAIEAALDGVRVALDGAGVTRKELNVERVKGLVEDLQTQIVDLLGQITDDEAKKTELANTIIANLMGTATDIVDQMPEDTVPGDGTPTDGTMPEQMMELAEQVKALANDGLEREKEMGELIPAFIEMTNLVKELAPLAQKAAAFDALAERVEAIEKLARVSPAQASRDARTALSALGIDAQALKKNLTPSKKVLGVEVKE
jgi:hypothetical protein